jgi:hypothetical protein
MKLLSTSVTQQERVDNNIPRKQKVFRVTFDPYLEETEDKQTSKILLSLFQSKDRSFVMSVST